MQIHLIATGGAVMHNLALALQNNHHTVSGSDDEIYNPARDRLAAAGLLPPAFGWFPERITADLDAVILGMHARKDNPELLRAQELGIPIYSFPAFIFQHTQKNKQKRVVVAGSHGKTSTTAMIMHVLQKSNRSFDYLVGAQLEGFETMVQLSDAPVIILEGDEYLSSPLDRRPKFLHYQPDICIITGIEHDHVNVFPDYEEYRQQFTLLAESMDSKAKLFYFDEVEVNIALEDAENQPVSQAYAGLDYEIKNGKTFVDSIEMQIFGAHNLQNMNAAQLVCQELGIDRKTFLEAIADFTGAAKRLQTLKNAENHAIFLDFAHAPSKVRATTNAVKQQFPERKLVAVFELHTFSSLNKDFLPNYANTLASADEAMVFFSPHTLKMKRLPELSEEEVAIAFQHENIRVFTDGAALEEAVRAVILKDTNLLLMSSGKFGGMDVHDLL